MFLFISDLSQNNNVSVVLQNLDYKISIPIPNYIVLYSATLKSVGYLVISSVENLRLSVCPSIYPTCPSVLCFPLSIVSIFLPIFFTLCTRVDIGKEWFTSHFVQELILQRSGLLHTF